MNEIKIFENEEFGRMRSVIIDGEPWFVGKDVAIALGYENPQKAIRDHIDVEDKKVGEQNVTPYIIDSLGRKQYPTYINESGMYALIFGSKLKSAKQFKRWVTSEVLPAIRKTGTYSTPSAQSSQNKTILDKLLDEDLETLKTIKSILYAPILNNTVINHSNDYEEKRPSSNAAAAAFKVRAIGKSQELASIRRHRDPKLARKEIFREMTARGVCWGSIEASAKSIEPTILDTNLDHLSVLPQFQEVFFRAADDLIREGGAGR